MNVRSLQSYEDITSLVINCKEKILPVYKSGKHKLENF